MNQKYKLQEPGILTPGTRNINSRNQEYKLQEPGI